MKNTLLFSILLLGLISCSKEEFAVNKGTQSTSLSALDSTTSKLCSQSTLISPQVDILMLWDNSSSFKFVTSETKKSMSKLISSVSENFDYHILSLPLVPASPTPLFEGQLVTKNNNGLSGNALGIVKTKESAVASLQFSDGNGSQETGIDRATQVIEQNRSNGIFRDGAYTIIIVMSNEDDKGCELYSPYSSCAKDDIDQYINPRITKLLCLRGNTFANCSGSGISSPLNSSMMRYINISPLTSCSNGFGNKNSRYRKVAKSIYEAPYSNNWPTSNDHLSPDVAGAFDSYNLCTIDFSHIFDGVNTAIKQTLLKHKYDYWPVTGSDTSLDPATLRVVRSDGKVLANRTGESNPSDGFGFVGIKTAQNTRFSPTAGEPFTGKMIQLFGSDGSDKIVYPDCLTVSYNPEKTTYGYVYLKFGEPVLSSIEVRINGNLIPQSATNGWSYMGLQYTNALDSNLKIAETTGESSGYYLRLNGSYKVSNTNSNTISVFYNSANK